MGSAFLGFAAASIVIVLLPGPDTLVVIRNLLRGGRRRAATTALGVLTGLAVWVVAATLGISAVLQASPTAYDVLRYVGAAYLAYLGLQALSSRVWGRRVMAHEDPLATPPRRHGPLLGSGFVAGLATDLLNPKVGVFFVTFLPAFVPAGSHVAPTTLAFGAVFVLETFAYFVVLIKAADRILDWMARPRTKRILDRAAGVVFIGFGLRLATEGS